MKRSHISGNGERGHGKPFPVRDNRFGIKSGRVAPGFGIGALEELDAEDEDVYGSGYDFEDSYDREIEEPSMLTLEPKKKIDEKEDGVLPGFKVATNFDYQLQRFHPPVIPKDFQPHHKFPAPLEDNIKFTDVPPLEVDPPENNNLKVLIEGVATLVARCGKLFEDLSREKNQSNPLFSFLDGGDGHDYYARKLWEERHKRNNDPTKQQPLDEKLFPSAHKMTAERRGNILGEKPLNRSIKDSSPSVTSKDAINLQFVLSDTFTEPASFTEPREIMNPFQNDPAKQERFEQFMKEKYEGGLRSKDSGGASYMSESARARERLEFEAAADAIKNGKWGKDSNPPNYNNLLDITATSGLQFTPGGLEPNVEAREAEELMMMKMYPKREEFQWRPFPLLCKRFDLLDPFMGKPPPPPRARSKMDSLIFMPDSDKATKAEKNTKTSKETLSVSQLDNNEEIEGINKELEVEVEVENVERPVDLYKAIFSDDEDDDDEKSNENQLEDPQKKTGVAKATLSRLIAGDFLESLGKELGMEVPPDLPRSENKVMHPSTASETLNTNKGDSNSLSLNRDISRGKPYNGKINDEGGCSRNADDIDKSNHTSPSKIREAGSSRIKQEKKSKSPTRQHDWSNSSSEGGRSRKRSRHHRRRRNDSDTDTSDSSDRDRSRSKGRKKESSRVKSSSRKHSKHHKHRSGSSPRKSSRYGSEKERRDSKRENRWKD